MVGTRAFCIAVVVSARVLLTPPLNRTSLVDNNNVQKLVFQNVQRLVFQKLMLQTQ